METFCTWLAAAVIAVLVGFGYRLDAEDHHYEFAQADEVEAAARQQEASARREAAARQLCAESGGTNTAAVWLVDGSLVCKTKHGRAIAKHPRGTL